MIAFLEFTFQSFWTFAGVAILLGVALDGLASIAGALCRLRKEQG